MRRPLTRKDFFKLAGAGAAGAAVAGTAGYVGGKNDGLSKVEERVPKKFRLLGAPQTNVVVVIVDSLRKDHLGAYGNDWIETPNIDALAKESLRFTRAYPESMPTICARRAIHTGIRTWPFRNWDSPYEDDVNLYGWEPVPQNQTTMAEFFQNFGYQTSMVTDTLHMFRPYYDFHRGFDSFDFIRGQERDLLRQAAMCPEDELENVLVGGESAKHAREIARQYLANNASRHNGEDEDYFSPQVFSAATEYLEALSSQDDPFFMVVDNYDPHEPWDPPEKYVSLYDEGYEGKEPLTASSGPSDWLSDRQLKRMSALYSGEVTMMDRHLGRFLDKFHELELGENTVLVFLSDHGHAFGEHGFAGKVPSALYPELTDVPLMIRHPKGKKSGGTHDYFASTHDIAPTVLGLLGVNPPEEMEGTDLSPIFDGEDPPPRPHFSIGYNNRALARDDRYAMFSSNTGGDAHLFDLQEDPEMDNDLASSDRDRVKRMFEDYVKHDAGGDLPNY